MDCWNVASPNAAGRGAPLASEAANEELRSNKITISRPSPELILSN